MEDNTTFAWSQPLQCTKAVLPVVEEAQLVVKNIARLNGVFSAGDIAQASQIAIGLDLLASNAHLKEISENATKRLALDLNDVLTHFVLECIQNADDNQYHDNVTPFLRFCVSPEKIQMDCNEKGFKESDVRSLCSVGNSLKSKQKVQDGRVGYIGEKGIGFKSVFKVAEQAHIYSFPFSFKFDKREELGMITPIWIPERDRQAVLSDDTQTTILLLPLANKTFAPILDDFRNISSTLLLFLRKLKKIELTITGLMPEDLRTSILKTLLCNKSEDGRVAIISEMSSDSFQSPKIDKYYMFEQIRDMPLNSNGERRKGVRKTEISLAFPVDSDGNPCNSTREVHAFLPIRDFGFKFLIQADFLVTSSRQDVEQDELWNKTLRGFIPFAFRDAVLDIMSSDNHELRYKWLHFLPRSISHAFWSPIQEVTQKVLRSSAVLESRAGQLQCTSQLFLLPDTLKDRYGDPIVGNDSNFVATHYKNSNELLQWLGVTEFPFPFILDELCLLGESVKAKPSGWHEDLSRYLVQHERDLKSFWDSRAAKINALPLIPLQDGSWTTANQLLNKPAYFRRDLGSIEVPADVNISLVDLAASGNPHRWKLLKRLGVKVCDKLEVAKEILKKHQKGVRAPLMDDAIIHARYLFNLETAILDKLNIQLWLYDEEKRPARGCDLYIRQSPGVEFSAAATFRSTAYPARFLSASYISSQPDVQWIPWLMKYTFITAIPRLVVNQDISPDFAFIFSSLPDKALWILKAHWNTYKDQLTGCSTATDKISNGSVRCFDGVSMQHQKLKDTFAPDPELKQISSQNFISPHQFPFLHIDGYSSKEWKFLEIFGVRFSPDLKFYGALLEQPQFRSDCTVQKFQQVLNQMAIVAGLGPSRLNLMSMFRTGSNFLLPSDDGVTWGNLSNCVWDAPQGFNGRQLKKFYDNGGMKECSFSTTLELRDATVEAVIKDLTTKTPSDTYLRAASLYIVRKLENSKDDRALLVTKKAFESNKLIQIPHNSSSKSFRVESTSCFWGNPKFGGPVLSFKHDLQPHYDADKDIRSLYISILELGDPSWKDVHTELKHKKGAKDTTTSSLANIYGYLIHRFSQKNSNHNAQVFLKMFEKESMVFIDSPGGKFWRKPSECVWRAPPFLRSKTAIGDQYSSCGSYAASFLQDMLSIKAAGIDDYIEDLEIMSTSGSCTKDEVATVYKHIELECTRETNLRAKFGSKKIIYDPTKTDCKWVGIKECVWEGKDYIQTTTKLASQYRASEALFCQFLGIKNATSKTLVNELKAIADKKNIPIPTAVLKRVKGLLFGLGQFAEKPNDIPSTEVETLKSLNIWPRKFLELGSANVALVGISSAFFVPDHPLLVELLMEKSTGEFPVLDLEESEVRKIKPLLVALGLENRLLSESVKEDASATDMSKPAENLTQDLRKRAEALFYCAQRFKPRHGADRDRFLEMLRSVQVYRTDDISSEYRIDSQGIKAEVTTYGLLRVVKENDELRVFVPEDETRQRTGYSIYLATELIGELEIPKKDSLQAVTALLTVRPEIEELTLILERLGIEHGLKDSTKQPLEIKDSNVATAFPALQPNSGDYFTEGQKLSTGSPQVSRVHESTVADALLPQPARPVSTDPIEPTRCQVSSPESRAEEAQIDQGKVKPSPLGPALPISQTPSPLRRGPGKSSPGKSRHDPEQIAAVNKSADASARFCNPVTAFTVAPMHRIPATADTSPSAFDMSSLLSAMPATPPHSPPRKKSPKRQSDRSHFDAAGDANPTAAPSLALQETSSPADSCCPSAIDLIGFQGEKFVVGMLQRILPDFDAARDWQSKLRVHAGRAAYAGAEISDVQYRDARGALSRFVRARMGADAYVPEWLARSCSRDGAAAAASSASASSAAEPPLTWFVEVKTTRNPCGEPLVVTTKQYSTMEEKAIGTQESPSEVYAIFRVYDLRELDYPKVRIYVDPWGSKDLPGGLCFKPRGYHGTPVS